MAVETDFAVEFYSNKHIKHNNFMLILWGQWGGGGGWGAWDSEGAGGRETVRL